MSDFNAGDFARRIDEAKTLQAAKAVFDDVAQLPDADRKTAVDMMEQAVVGDWLRTAPTQAQLGQLRMTLDYVDSLKGTHEGDLLIRQLEQGMPKEASQVSSFVMRSLLQHKGDGAHALVKLFVDALDSQPADEANTGFGFAKLMVTVQEKYLSQANTPAAPKQNPFRKRNNFNL